MALNLDALGQKVGPITKDYTWKNAVLYALGVGAGFSDLDYCYEKNLKVLPSFSMSMIFDMLAQFGIKSNVNLAGVLHGEQELIFHNPIPSEGTMTTEGKIARYYDKGDDKGALIIGESDTYHSNGQKLFTSICTIFSRLDGGFGGEASPKTTFEFPDWAPDFIVNAVPTEDQPLIYRLSGDIFGLHVDPEFAKMSGFEKPIMHGLCTHGFACRALIEKLIPGQPEKARRMVCRFSDTLYPGIPIQTQIWKTRKGEAFWKIVNRDTGDIVINNGVFEYGDVLEMQIRFDDQVAIITGAGAGLGRAYALELARRGAKVVVNDLGGSRDGSSEGSASPADNVVQEIKDMGGQAVANYDNVATEEGGENIVKTAVDTFGTVDILINNAGILRDKTFIKMEPENWEAIMNVHLNGAYNVTRPAFKVMKKNAYGRILMTTSAAGLYGNYGQTNYSAAKMGLVGFMNTLKIEGVKYDININTIAPIAASRLTEDVLPPDIFDKMEPEFVVPMALYLCSNVCSVTGNIYNAGMGFYNRATVVTGPGVVLTKDGATPTVEDIKNSFGNISSLKNGKEFFQGNDQVVDALTAFSAPPPSVDKAVAGFTSAADIFAAMPDAFVADAASGVDVIFQYHIAGDVGGDWYCIIADSTCSVEAGTHNSPVCTLKMEDADFIAMMNGTLSPIQAYTSGKLKIEGDIMKSQLIDKLFKF